MGYPDNDLERPTYRSERRGAPPPPSHSPSQEYRSRKGRDDYERENRHPNGDTRRRNKRRSPPPLGDARRRRMAPPADSPPPRGRDTRPTPEREDYRKGYEAAKKEMLRNLSGATDEGPSRDTSRARRGAAPARRARRRSPERRERRRDSPERRAVRSLTQP